MLRGTSPGETTAKSNEPCNEPCNEPRHTKPVKVTEDFQKFLEPASTTVVFPHQSPQKREGPGLKALKDSASFMGLKAHAPSVISDLQL
jgi:hypothetical protein